VPWTVVLQDITAKFARKNIKFWTFGQGNGLSAPLCGVSVVMAVAEDEIDIKALV